MNNNNYVEFKKQRDLGAIITDTFKFLRLEWKPFFGTVFKIAIIPILFAIAGILYYSFEQANMYSGIDFTNPETVDTNPFSGVSMAIATFVFLLSYLIAFIVINVASMYYLKSYINNNGVVKYEEVVADVKENIWAFVGMGILIGIMFTIGAFLCLVPAIYLWPILSLTTCVFVFKGKSVMDSITYSFEFIKDHWWETFAVLLVLAILVGILSTIFQIPAIVYTMVRTFVSMSNEDPTAIVGLFGDPIYLALNVISYFGRFLFYAVTLVSTVLIFFDINEQKYASGTIEKIDSLGQ